MHRVRPECERLVRMARDYAQRHATMPVDLDAVRIRATARPRYTGDIGITVARLVGGEAGMERIAIDVQCADTPEGEAFCAGPEVSAIRRDFRHALTKGALD